MEVEYSTTNPQPCAKDLQSNDKQDCERTDASLDRKASFLAHIHGSFDLEITDEPTGCPGHVDPYRDLARSLRIGVEVIRIYSHGRDYKAEDTEAPCEGRKHVVVGVFETEAEEHQPGEAQTVAEA
jgi:hypothetical protein